MQADDRKADKTQWLFYEQRTLGVLGERAPQF